MIAFVEDHRPVHGVEPFCRELAIAPSTYHAHAARKADPSKATARARGDGLLRGHVRRVWEENFRVYQAENGLHQGLAGLLGHLSNDVPCSERLVSKSPGRRLRILGSLAA